MTSRVPRETSLRLSHGGLVDRSRTLTFTFDGQAFRGHPGDTLASALLANGVQLVGRSFKYHRPRGIFSAGSEEPNALVELRAGARREPNTRATVAELFDGLAAQSQNRWPSLDLDLMAVNQLVAPFLPAGFYYKTFMWPQKFWEALYEPLIRRAAGLGRAPRAPDPDTYEKAFAHCDVLVVGSGPAGLMAALAAARSGARVILADEDFRFGGRLLSDRQTLDGRPALDWVSATLAELQSLDSVRLMPRTTVYGVYDHGTYGAVERVNDHVAVPPEHQPRQRGWRIVARHCVLAAGAIERPVVFGGNDLPGVMLASAVRSYINRFAVTPGRRAVVFTACDDGWRTASDLQAAGIAVAAVVDPRTGATGSSAIGGVPLCRGAHVFRAIGDKHVKAIEIIDDRGSKQRIACDLLAVSNGWSPALHLTCHLGGRPVWNDALKAFVPGALPIGMCVAGAAAGHMSLAEALADGAHLGAEAAAASGFAAAHCPIPVVEAREGVAVDPVWRVRPASGKAFVDLQNDVTDKDVELAYREGYRSVEHVKRYTTLGMATDQGKTANVPGLAIMAEIAGRAIPEVGTTVFRPPYTPVALGALAGHHKGREFRPVRLTPSHAWAEGQGAVFTETGLWLRAQWYPRPGETDWRATVAREVTATRSAVGVCDVTTLGKIDVQGADAAAFLDRVYTNTLSTLAVGKARYGLMLREDGFVMDDGTVSRLGSEHFFVTTTTANAAKVMQHLEFCHQVLWPDLDVALMSVSEQWAQYSIAGPRSRDVLRLLADPGHDVSNAALPYMGVQLLTVCGGVEARLFRVSFSGEIAYEIAVPTHFGDALIRAIMSAGRDFGITPYGTEALNVMRIEKGHAGGPEINGQTTARDLGMAKMVSAKKDCIGRVMSARPALVAEDRPILVGVKPLDPSHELTAGSHFISLGAKLSAENDEGHLTSVAYSPALQTSIGLGFLKNGQERIGDRIRAVDLLRSRDIACEVCAPVFYDPQGERLRG